MIITPEISALETQRRATTSQTRRTEIDREIRALRRVGMKMRRAELKRRKEAKNG